MNTNFLLENLKGRKEWRHIDVDGKILLKWIYKMLGLCSPDSEYGPLASSCEDGNDSSDFI
jgi:hypothetical protein